MTGNHVVVVCDFPITDFSKVGLLDNFLLQQSLHLDWRPDFAVASWVMRVFTLAEYQVGELSSEVSAGDRSTTVTGEWAQFIIAKSQYALL